MVILYGDTQECVKMQNFIDSFATNTRAISTRLSSSQNLNHRVNAVIKMVRHEGTCSAFNAFPYVICFETYYITHNPRSAILSTKNVTYISKSFVLTHIYNITTLHDIACAPMYDGVSEIIFQILEERCSKGEIYQHTKFFGSHPL